MEWEEWKGFESATQMNADVRRLAQMRNGHFAGWTG
jgi:hypothetical protein